MKKKYYIYVYNYLHKEIKRNTEPIIRELAKQYGLKRCIVIYSEKNADPETLEMPPDTLMIYNPSLDAASLEKITAAYPPSLLLVVAQRIPDMLMLSVFNRWNVPTVLLQHGMLVDFLPRVPILFLIAGNIRKIWKYVNYSLKIARANGLSRRKTLRDVFQIFITGREKATASEGLARAQTIAGSAMIFDSTWDDFFTDMYGYQKSQFVHIGTIDLAKLKDVKKNPKEDAVGYICQTLVEDGRFRRKQYEKFVAILGECLPDDRKLYMKLHPRSDRSLFQRLENRPNVIFTNAFPYCTKYLGHYSSMLDLAYHCSPFIFLWDFPDHRIPAYFRKYGYRIGHEPDELKSFLSADLSRASEPPEYHPLSEDDIQGINPIKSVCEHLFRIHSQTEREMGKNG